MPIPKNIKMNDCVGKYAIVDKDIMCGSGMSIRKGSQVYIYNHGRGLTIKTDTCPHCGLHFYCRGVKKEDLTLIGE
jgi:hypothetical protein